MINKKIASGLYEHELKFNSDSYHLLIEHNLINFDKDAFDNDLPKDILTDWTLSLLGEKLANDDLELRKISNKKLSIKSIVINEKTYSTFLNYIKDLTDPSDYAQAIFKLSAKKINQTEIELDDIINKIPMGSDLIKSMTQKIRSETENLFKNTFEPPIDRASDKNPSFIQSGVQDFLTSKRIPIEQKDQSFYFSVTKDSFEWNIEIYIPKDEFFINFYSSFSYKVVNTELAIVLDNINDLNLAINTGNYEFNKNLELFCFKNFSFIFEDKIEETLALLLDESELKMLSILPFIEKLKTVRKVS